jgi:hypothetical protein
MNREKGYKYVALQKKTKLSEVINNLIINYETTERTLYELIMMIDPECDMFNYFIDLCNWKEIYEFISNRYNILINTQLEKELIRKIIYIEKAILSMNYDYDNNKPIKKS